MVVDNLYKKIQANMDRNKMDHAEVERLSKFKLQRGEIKHTSLQQAQGMHEAPKPSDDKEAIEVMVEKSAAHQEQLRLAEEKENAARAVVQAYHPRLDKKLTKERFLDIEKP